MNFDSAFVIRPQVVSRKVGDETVILALDSGTYFGLDPVGTRVWCLIEVGKSLGQVCDLVIEEYDVQRDILERDLLALIGDLLENKLIDVE